MNEDVDYTTERDKECIEARAFMKNVGTTPEWMMKSFVQEHGHREKNQLTIALGVQFPEVTRDYLIQRKLYPNSVSNLSEKEVYELMAQSCRNVLRMNTNASTDLKRYKISALMKLNRFKEGYGRSKLQEKYSELEKGFRKLAELSV